MAIPLLATKFFLPPVRAERVQRERLLARLDEVLRPTAQLALISAPAGFGKTSLLAEWIARRGKAAAWLSLDAGDNTPELFLAYLAAALGRACPGLARDTAALLEAQPPAPLETILAVLVNELSALPPADPLIIALDDFQFVTSAEVRQTVTFLVEHLPPGARLVIATRSDPPLPLARLRARGQMVELRAVDLRFNNEEAALFLSQAMGLNLEADQLREAAGALSARTEGWAAGLQMAALALQQAPEADLAERIRAFSGSHRYVIDYLVEEVLSRLPQETVDFLLSTSVLKRMCAELCAAVVQSMENLLPALDRANLFLIPLDAERRWFRYHHLFADLLRARLKQEQPQAIAGLHRRAAAWFEQNGYMAEAIQHLLSAAAADKVTAEAADKSTAEAEVFAAAKAQADYQQAARLVEENTLILFQRGELHSLQRWVGLLPPHLADQRPWLCVYRAWIMLFAGRLDQLEPLLVKALQSAEQAGERRDELEGNCAAIRCFGAIFTPDLSPVFEHYRLVEVKLPEDGWARGVAEWAVGFAVRATGDLERAGQIFERQVHRGLTQSQSDPWGMAMTATDLGIVRRLQGRLREAEAVYRRGLEFVEAHGARKLGYTGRLLTALASMLYDRNQLEESRRLLEEAVGLNQLWRNPNHLVYSYLTLARVLIAQNDYAQASEMLDAAAAVLRDLPVIPSLSLGVEAGRLNLRLAHGEVPPTSGPLEAQIQAALEKGLPPGALSEAVDAQILPLARVLVAQRRPAEAQRLLNPLLTAAQAGGRVMSQIEALALLALAAYEENQSILALEWLTQAVKMGEAEGIIRTIMDLASLVPGGLRALLTSLRRGTAVNPAYLDQLIAVLPAEPTPPADSQPEAVNAVIPLPEPITEREMEVLRLLAEGLTNVQIAARLVISAGTVKAHTASIFRKLDAANRTQAVTRARELGLIRG